MAEKLRRLFAASRQRDGAEWSNRDVVVAIRARGVELSESHFSELRRGIKVNPTVRVLQAVADVFDVRVAYFFDDPAAVAQVEADLELRAAMRDAQVQQFAARAAGLSPAQRVAFQHVLAAMIRDESGQTDTAGSEDPNTDDTPPAPPGQHSGDSDRS